MLLLFFFQLFTIVVVSIFHDGCRANRIYCFLSGARSNRQLLRCFRRYRQIHVTFQPTIGRLFRCWRIVSSLSEWFLFRQTDGSTRSKETGFTSTFPPSFDLTFINRTDVNLYKILTYVFIKRRG